MEASNLMDKVMLGRVKQGLKSCEIKPGTESWSQISSVSAQTTVLWYKGKMRVVGVLLQLF